MIRAISDIALDKCINGNWETLNKSLFFSILCDYALGFEELEQISPYMDFKGKNFGIFEQYWRHFPPDQEEFDYLVKLMDSMPMEEFQRALGRHFMPAYELISENLCFILQSFFLTINQYYN